VEKLRLPILLGTSRKLRKSEFVAKWLVGEMEKRSDIETRLFDVVDFALPEDHYGQEIKHLFPEWRNAIIEADGLVIVSPEYNHGYPGSLKAVLDLLLTFTKVLPLSVYRLVPGEGPSAAWSMR
jgi:NAD(P)H-dependent FMN reductase